MRKAGLLIACIIVVGIGTIALFNLQHGKMSESSSTPQAPLSENKQAATDPSWETYVNKEYGFSLRYPPSWRFEDNKLENKRTIQLFNYPSDKYIGGVPLQEGDIKIEAVVLKNPENMTLLEFVEEQSTQGLYASQKHLINEDSLGESPAVTDVIEGDTTYKSYYVSLMGDNVLVLTVSPHTEDPDVHQILSTFTKE